MADKASTSGEQAAVAAGGQVTGVPSEHPEPPVDGRCPSCGMTWAEQVRESLAPPSEAHYLRLLTRGEPTTEDRIAARMLAGMHAARSVADELTQEAEKLGLYDEEADRG